MSWHGYAQTKLSEFLDKFDDGLRDITNSVLSPYYDEAQVVTGEEQAVRSAASSAFRLANGLPPISSDAFAFQISAGSSKAVFEEYVRALGIEAVYEEDLSSAELSSALLTLPGLADVISALLLLDLTPDIEAIEERFIDMDIPIQTGTVLHISQPEPPTYGEEDSVIAEKMNRTKGYVNSLLGLEG